MESSSSSSSTSSSLLRSIGGDLISIITPVSICMLLVVLLVSTLSSTPTSSSSPSSTLISAANLVYTETAADSASTKLEGALLNAAVFVLLVAALTFLLVFLYYLNCTSFLTHYMRFSAFFVLSFTSSPILVSIIRQFLIPIDAFSFVVLVFNFSVIGVISVFPGPGVPIVVSQGYMVVLGIVVAVWFTRLPEWTTWITLVAMAGYDLVAVLAPVGPLRILVELAQSRDDSLPAFVYEARPRVEEGRRRRGSGGLGLLVAGVSDDLSIEAQNRVSRNDDGGGSIELQNMVSRISNGDRSTVHQSRVSRINSGTNEIEIVDDEDVIVEEVDGERTPLVGEITSARERRSLSGRGGLETGGGDGRGVEEMAPLVEMLGMEDGGGDEAGASEIVSTRGTKLGLGDFVFYSVLVGRAAMYDLMTVYACYLAIICGLGCTLILLFVFRRALPALPISVALGVIFYFLTRLLMEPFVVGISINLMMF